jgi:hypothetical protein
MCYARRELVRTANAQLHQSTTVCQEKSAAPGRFGRVAYTHTHRHTAAAVAVVPGLLLHSISAVFDPPPAGVWRRATPRLRGGRTDEVVAPGPYTECGRKKTRIRHRPAGAGTRARAAHRGFTWTTPTWQPIDGRDAWDARSGRAPFR